MKKILRAFHPISKHVKSEHTFKLLDPFVQGFEFESPGSTEPTEITQRIETDIDTVILEDKFWSPLLSCGTALIVAQKVACRLLFFDPLDICYECLFLPVDPVDCGDPGRAPKLRAWYSR